MRLWYNISYCVVTKQSVELFSYSVGFPCPDTDFCTHPWRNPPCLCRWVGPAFPGGVPSHCRSVTTTHIFTGLVPFETWIQIMKHRHKRYLIAPGLSQQTREWGSSHSVSCYAMSLSYKLTRGVTIISQLPTACLFYTFSNHLWCLQLALKQ